MTDGSTKDLSTLGPIDFGLMSILIAASNNVETAKLTKFQARLKNLHRVGWPIDFKAIKGKASIYHPGDVLDMAIAVELIQLGLTPERIANVLRINRWPTLMAYRMAAESLASRPEDLDLDEMNAPDAPLRMFIYFDPSALDSLTRTAEVDWSYDWDAASASFFYGGLGVVREGLGYWTHEAFRRIALVNVTATLSALTINGGESKSERDTLYRKRFFESVRDWAEAKLDEIHGGDVIEESYVAQTLAKMPIRDGRHLAEITGVPGARADNYFIEFQQGLALEKGDPDGERS